MIADLISIILISIGIFFILVSAIGLIRMPDVFSRMHPAGMIDSVGAGFLLLGFLVQSDEWIIALKLILIFVFLVFASPVATHALAHAALLKGLKPWTKKNEEDKKS